MRLLCHKQPWNRPESALWHKPAPPAQNKHVQNVRNTPARCSKDAALILGEGVKVSESDALYPVQLEEAFHLFTFSSGAAHQQVTELVHRP